MRCAISTNAGATSSNRSMRGSLAGPSPARLWRSLRGRLHVDRERCVVAHILLAGRGAATVDLAGVAHADALHHRPRTQVVADGARHHRAHPENVERVLEPRGTDLRRIAPAPVVAAQCPTDLQPLRVRPERKLALVGLAHPRLVGKNCVQLTPIVVDRRAREAAATNDVAGLAV